ncbi:pyridoxal-phosphate dependent enzyme [Lipingzhangella sp. LS1_29]|uniref:Pyridoxal-phosphate dependent enzyme n=1 Tax=Lipingzhangella rawalii TaxID=2055835 RepID=A0ABU2H3N4_9ACTN|nr:pyridoxal-phosphate dependent enzyme [Lipingzhangella rawalii]MDS1269435.1 pyridoxal-phosphate dependent enzyme [Lipingzhangella rawalii]
MDGTNLDLDLDRIAQAHSRIDPVFRNTPQFVDPQLCAALNQRVVVKMETLNPLRSFKGRGVDLLAHELEPGTRLVCQSTGNFGQAIGYAAARRGLSADVFVPSGVSPVKLARMTSLGVRVHEVGNGRPKEAARAYAAARENSVFVEDGQHPRIAEGAGSIGVELLTAGPIDTVVLPVGDGALITGVARWMKEHAPHTRIVGVCAQGASSMVDSWRAGCVRATGRADTFAEGIAIPYPVPESVERMRLLVDDMVLVNDTDLLVAMRTALANLGVLPEPAGAAGLAAIATHNLPGDVVATVITGGNVSPALFPDILAAGEQQGTARSEVAQANAEPTRPARPAQF